MDLAALSPLSPADRTRATQLRGEALRAAAPAEQRAAVAAQFEAILVRQLLGPTLTKLLDSGEGVAAGVYGDLLTDTLATQLAAGKGLGLGRMIEVQLAPRSRAAAAPDPTAATPSPPTP
jgi:Rod binding domain-containing protein